LPYTNATEDAMATIRVEAKGHLHPEQIRQLAELLFAVYGTEEISVARELLRLEVAIGPMPDRAIALREGDGERLFEGTVLGIERFVEYLDRRPGCWSDASPDR
jgi:hypothetical protein